MRVSSTRFHPVPSQFQNPLVTGFHHLVEVEPGTHSDPSENRRAGTVCSAPTLRPYQLAAVAAVLDAFRAGDRRTLLVLATGLGKTVCFADIARLGAEHGRRVLVLAHRTELLEQALAKLRAVGVDAAIEQGPNRAGDAAVVVASVQTLRGKRLASWPADSFHLIVIDESHHATATSYRTVLDHFAAARVLGVTATPDRGDGQALGDVFESVAYRYELRAAIRDGWLAPIRARRVVLEGVDLSSIHTRAGDLALNELAAVMGDEEALHGVAVPLLELAGDRRTIVFAVDVAHAHALAEVMNRYQPGVARAVDGSASSAVRSETLEAFRAGAFRVLVNCALFTEGFDEPSISCVAIARPTKSRALYSQMVGRGTRLAPGKADCLVLDFTGTAGRHRLVGPADALAGTDLADDLRAELEAMLAAGDHDIDQALEAATAEVADQRERAKVLAVAQYRAEELDPFIGDIPPMPTGRWTADPATGPQRRALIEVGLDKLPEQLTRGEASRWLAAIDRRRQAGLATLRQSFILARYAIDCRAMPMREAGELLARLRNAGWRPSALWGRDAAA